MDDSNAILSTHVGNRDAIGVYGSLECPMCSVLDMFENVEIICNK